MSMVEFSGCLHDAFMNEHGLILYALLTSHYKSSNILRPYAEPLQVFCLFIVHIHLLSSTQRMLS